MLGSGSCELRAERSSPSYLLQGGGAGLMLDLGQGAWRRLTEAGHRPHELTGVFLSHHHLDHLSDLLPLLFALNYDPVMHERARLTLWGHPQIGEVLAGLAGVFGDWVRPGEERLRFDPAIPGEPARAGDMALTFAPAHHIGSSLALRASCAGESLVYLGDSEAGPGLAEFAAGAGLLIAHTAAPDQRPKKGHLTPTAAGELAQAAGAGGLLLSHLYREVDPHEAQAAAAAAFSGPVWAARDLMRIRLQGGRPRADSM